MKTTILLILLAVCAIHTTTVKRTSIDRDNFTDIDLDFLEDWLGVFDTVPYDDSRVMNEWRKLICALKLGRTSKDYQHHRNATKADFHRLCEKFRDLYTCFSGATYGNDPLAGEERFHMTKSGMADDLYECAKPTFEVLNGLCSLSYEAAKKVENCHELASMFYRGSFEILDCRERCCHDSSTYNASEPYLCAPEKAFFDGWFRPCLKPVPSQTLKDNACMRICTTKQYVKYTRWFCNQDAKAVFQTYAGEMLNKYQNMGRCFQQCPMAPPSEKKTA